MKFMRPDAWTGTHLFGSFFLVHFLQYFSDNTITEILLPYFLVFLIGLAWELLSVIYPGGLKKMLDPRGGDWGDIIANSIGILLAIVF